jgi:hypothetical protein
MGELSMNNSKNQTGVSDQSSTGMISYRLVPPGESRNTSMTRIVLVPIVVHSLQLVDAILMRLVLSLSMRLSRIGIVKQQNFLIEH